ncbi:ribosome maturation factor RimM [Breznakiella homolactica]|uniref:Ribosome maturation factor RimM n=1 Tax=Breznakiella homolactica TaxID=2798577 RepID=A0A7T8BAP4_9SPIR|nr:ribosome maturation factor RimM [Breznakiella homolactica]QQO09707.1 ribosome maturation factor RimM [Breznakiella homolactica]
MTERFVAGLVGSPHGIKGFVKIRSLSGERDHFFELKNAVLWHKGREQQYEIEEVTDTAAALLVKFRGIDSPEAAKLLAGAEILVDRDQAVPLYEDEYYIEDLKGLRVVYTGDAESPVGEITDVMEGGGGELIEIRLSSGEYRLVPFRKEFFGDIDLTERRAVLLEPWILE